MRARLLAALVASLALAGCTLGEFPAGAGDLTVRSPTVQDAEELPRQHTCDGQGTSPALSIGELPPGAETVALVVDDQDTPGRVPYAHWLVWNVPVSGGTASLPEDSVPSQAREGTNGAGATGYDPPCPPRSDEAHTYRFTVYAVDRSLPLEQGAERSELVDALEGHVLAQGRLSATYDR